MVDKVTLTTLANLQNDSTATSAINANNAATTTAINNTLSRDGTSPNSMGANLDMNSNRILNLAAPVSSGDPLRLGDYTVLQTGGSLTYGVPTGGSINAILTKSSTVNYDVGWTTFSFFIAGTKAVTINNTLTIAGSDASTLTFQGTDTYVGRATTDTLTNKTFNTAGTGNNFQVGGNSITSVTGTGAAVVLASSPALTNISVTGSITVTGSIQASNNIQVSGGKIGYTTGAGGSVTQLTSKSTGVVLNTACGVITTHNSSLAAVATASFTLTNSTLSAPDVICLTPTAATGVIYQYAATPASGSASIFIRNPSGGTLADAITIQFAIIKAVQA